MTEPQTYYDVDGNECSLDTLCRREPAWAANRIRVLIAKVQQLSGVAQPDGVGQESSQRNDPTVAHLLQQQGLITAPI